MASSSTNLGVVGSNPAGRAIHRWVHCGHMGDGLFRRHRQSAAAEPVQRLGGYGGGNKPASTTATREGGIHGPVWMKFPKTAAHCFPDELRPPDAGSDAGRMSLTRTSRRP